jgi:short-subunit dehydrogenase
MIKVYVYILIVTSFLIGNINAAQKAIVIGASSGMGREVAKLLSRDGYDVGLVARRLPLLHTLQKELPGPSIAKQIDVIDTHARESLSQLIKDMQGLDLIVISISPDLDNRNETATYYNPQQEWQQKARIIDVCAKGFIAMADVALEFFKKQNHGHLVGISSTSALRGSPFHPEYSAAKACISCYMEGIRNHMIQNKINVHITDVLPGYVAVEHLPLGADPEAYWEITVQEAGKNIIAGIKAKKKIAYVPSKVWLVACLLKLLPDYIYNKYFYWI